MRESDLETEAIGEGIPSGGVIAGPAGSNALRKMLSTKVEKHELEVYLKEKSSKHDIQILMR